MALEEVVLPKEYRNARILFEQNLDKWRVKAQQSFNVTNLNLAQIAKDCFLPGYDYDNDGLANYGLSLEARLNSIISGGAILTGTAYPSWTINSTASSATMTTSILTAPRTYQFPDVSGTFLLNYATQPGNAIRVNQDIIAGGSPFLLQLVCGAHTNLTASTEASDLIFDLARTVTFATGNIVTQRAFRISAPTYAFAAASVITDASTLYISGAPIAGANATLTNTYALNVASGLARFADNIIWNSGVAFSGTLDHANTGNRVYTFPDITGAVLLDAAIQTVTGAKTFNTDTLLIPNAAPTVSRSIGLASGILQAHDGTSAKSYLRTDTYTEAVWDGGAIFNLGTAIDGAFADVAGGAQIVQNVTVPGRYLVTFEFNFFVVVNSTKAGSGFTYFRLTDGTTNKKPIKVGYAADETTTGGSTSEQSVTLVEVFNFTTTGNKTIKLQKQNFTALAAGDGTRGIEAINNVSLEMKVIRVAD